MNRMASNATENNPGNSPTLQDVSLLKAYENVCDLRETIGRGLSSRLIAAGFDDIPESALIILWTMFSYGTEARALIRRLGIDGLAASQFIETLVLHGYLEFQDDPSDPRQPTIAFTERAQAAIKEARIGLKTDWWAEFPHRSGDIVVSAVPKSGTTWVQMICALLIFQTPRLPASLPKLSPYMEELCEISRAEAYAQLAAQQHRRFIKTHSSLSEMPADPRVTYIAVARHPLDVLVSLHYQMSVLFPADTPGRSNGNEWRPEAARKWLLDNIDEMGTFPDGHDSRIDVILKMSADAWERRAEHNVVLVHYEDLIADLAAEMRRLARCLDITVPEDKWPGLVQSATFKQMRSDADHLQPLQSQYSQAQVARKPPHAAFFRHGASGDGRALLTAAEAARYRTRAAQVAPPELLAWLHRDDDRAADSIPTARD
jgi:aryl sulfotransferase